MCVTQPTFTLELASHLIPAIDFSYVGLFFLCIYCIIIVYTRLVYKQCHKLSLTLMKVKLP